MFTYIHSGFIAGIYSNVDDITIKEMGDKTKQIKTIGTTCALFLWCITTFSIVWNYLTNFKFFTMTLELVSEFENVYIPNH